MDNSDIYSQACSIRTLQSDKNGFFSEFIDEVKFSVGDKWLKNYFGQLKSDQARILSIFNDREICDIVLGVLDNVRPVFKPKDANFSSQRRLQAEKCFLNGELQKSLMLINQAVVRSPAKGDVDNGITLALALWTRSNILLEMGEGERALNDLKLATTIGLNTKQNVEYYFQMAKSYAQMGESARAKVALGITETLLAGNDTKISKMRQEILDIVPTNKRITKKIEPNLTDGQNPHLKGASNSVTLSKSPDKGRFISATNNLKAGDIVLVEEPAVACLLPDYYGSHCCHCFERIFAPVGCIKCSGMAFCSLDCMKEATRTYHKYECEFSDMFIGSGMSILCYVALRVFTQSKSIDEGLILADDLINNLCTHSEYRQPIDFLHRGIMAAFLLRCLQKAGYFGIRKTEAVNPTSKEIQVASALLGLLQVLQFNAHEIFETMTTGEHRFDGSKMKSVGAAIYRTGSYFNHDCCPNVARYFVGKSIIMACTRPFNAGDTVNENYGPIFTKINVKDRQRALKARYMFECSCDACKENWPTLQKLDKSVKFKCPSNNCYNLLKHSKDISKDVRCVRCKKTVSLKDSVLTILKVEELYNDGALAMKNQQTEDAIGFFSEGINLFFQVAVMPHKDTLIAQESLRICFADTGTTFIKENFNN